MNCPACHREIPDDSRFCHRCGVAVERACASCGQSNAAEAHFCRGCGSPLGTPAGRAGAPAASADPSLAGNVELRPTGGERRHLTVVFSDLVGSTELASRLDPEEWRDIVRRYHRAAAEVVTRYGGHVAQYLGDGVLAYFGWPHAHDDDAERAVRAGLGICEAASAVASGLAAVRSISLAVRVGMHTGRVVVGDDGAIFGEAANVAARVQGLAAPGTVVITGTTHRLVSGMFVVEELGPQALKGVAASVALYRIRQSSGVRGRLAAAGAGGLTPFVGREEERRLLRARWEQTAEGDGQVVVITGEPGIGKSRLVLALREDLAGVPHTWIECVCSRFFENTPFRPVVDMMQQAFGWREDESGDDQLTRLARSLESAGVAVGEGIPLLAPLLGLEVPADHPPLLYTAERQRRRLLATLASWLFGLARLQPVVLVVEDAHWVDPSTLELLGLLVEQAATAPLLLVVTARPEFRVPWPVRAHHAHLTLSRLSRRDVREMVRQVIARAALPDEMVEAVITRTDGVPLFVEELTRLVLEGDRRNAHVAQEIPTTLQASLMARLDRLGSAKDVAQTGAVIGREFSYVLLQAVSGLADEELEAALETLADAELVHRRGLPPDAIFVFKHALVQDAAYGSLLKTRRRELHSVIARVIGEKFPEVGVREPELLAHHLTEAGEAPAAVAAWQCAGAQAITRSAHAEAIGHLTRGLAVLETLPDTPERAQDEVRLLIPFCQAVLIVNGYGSPEAESAIARSRQAIDRMGDSPTVFFSILGAWASALGRGDWDAMRELSERLLKMVESSAPPGAAVWAHFARGATHFHHGEFAAARQALQQAVRLYREEDHRGGVQDPGVASLAYAGLVAWHAGFPDTARDQIRAGIELARRLGHSFDLALAQSQSGVLRVLMRDQDNASRTLAELDALVHTCTEQQFPYFLAHATGQRGWAVVQQGDHERGIDEIRRAVALGSPLTQGLYLCVLAKALVETGASLDAWAVLEDLLATPRNIEPERADLLCLRADLLEGQGAVAVDIERGYRDAIELAQTQGSRAYELRATIHLGRWLCTHGRAAEVPQLLSPVYAWFTEGHDTPDLREAAALLDKIGPNDQRVVR